MSYELALRERYAEARGRLGMPYGAMGHVRVQTPANEPANDWEPVPEPQRDYLFIAESYADPEDEQKLDAIIKAIPVAPWRVILSEVCRKHGMTQKQVIGQQRNHNIVLARHEAMYRMAHETRMSLPMIGRRLGDRDHTTVLHGLRQHAARNGLTLFGGGPKPNYSHQKHNIGGWVSDAQNG